MDATQMIEQLVANGNRIRSMLEGVSQEQAIWRPDAASWSILEVINHLYDEERQDFRVRLNLILYDPESDWPPIDPAGWVTSRKYNEREIQSSQQNFWDERQASLAWLRSLPDPDWNAVSEKPFGRMTAGDMFASWVAHDTLHLRQFVELHRAYIVHLAQSYDVSYAGEW